MARGKIKAYKEQSFDHLRGLDGISDDQIAEHLKLYSGYVKQVNTLNEDLHELLGKGCRCTDRSSSDTAAGVVPWPTYRRPCSCR